MDPVQRLQSMLTTMGCDPLNQDYIPPSSQPPPSAQVSPPHASAQRPPHQQKPRRNNGHLKPAKPSNQHFDAWNSSSTGHQRAENRVAGSTAWRNSRSTKLTAQFRGGAGGGVRVADTVGQGSENFGKDGRKANGGWVRGAPGLREKGQMAIWETMGGGVKRKRADILAAGRKEEEKGEERVRAKKTAPTRTPAASLADEENDPDLAAAIQASLQDHNRDPRIKQPAPPPPPSAQSPPLPASPPSQAQQPKQIFHGLCFYINGSTYPTISDHKLKHLLATHGATTSLSLARRSVTHVILGQPASRTGAGAGGGLAARKLHKEIVRTGGRGVRYVGVEWVVESVRAGKRLSEARFADVKIASRGQGSVGDMLRVEGHEDGEG